MILITGLQNMILRRHPETQQMGTGIVKNPCRRWREKPGGGETKSMVIAVVWEGLRGRAQTGLQAADEGLHLRFISEEGASDVCTQGGGGGQVSDSYICFLSEAHL